MIDLVTPEQRATLLEYLGREITPDLLTRLCANARSEADARHATARTVFESRLEAYGAAYDLFSRLYAEYVRDQTKHDADLSAWASSDPTDREPWRKQQPVAPLPPIAPIEPKPLTDEQAIAAKIAEIVAGGKAA